MSLIVIARLPCIYVRLYHRVFQIRAPLFFAEKNFSFNVFMSAYTTGCSKLGPPYFLQKKIFHLKNGKALQKIIRGSNARKTHLGAPNFQIFLGEVRRARACAAVHAPPIQKVWI
jgi:hypothetical protein